MKHETKKKITKEQLKAVISIAKKVICGQIVENKLDELYITNPTLVLKKLEKLANKSPLKEEDVVIIYDFKSEKQKLVYLLESINNEKFEENKNMYLFYAVSIFEQMINRNLSFELRICDIPTKIVNKRILRHLSYEDKLGWLTKLISDKSFVEEKKELWQGIRTIVDTRNFFMHYKPEHPKKRFKKELNFRKEDLIKFIKDVTKCNNYILKCNSKKAKEVNKKIEKTEGLFMERLAKATKPEIDKTIKLSYSYMRLHRPHK